MTYMNEKEPKKPHVVTTYYRVYQSEESFSVFIDFKDKKTLILSQKGKWEDVDRNEMDAEILERVLNEYAVKNDTDAKKRKEEQEGKTD